VQHEEPDGNDSRVRFDRVHDSSLQAVQPAIARWNSRQTASSL
jgi:hypothetical protein